MKEFEDLKELLHEEDIQFTKNVEKRMDKKISKKVYKNFFIIIITCLLSLSGIHVLMKGSMFNPNETNTEFSYILSSYVNLYYPTTITYQYNEIEDKLFAKYEMDVQFINPFHGIYIGPHETLTINQGKIDFSNLYEVSANWVNRFDVYNRYSESEESKEYILTELEKLPNSTYINADIIFEKEKSLDETVSFINEYPNTHFKWIGFQSFRETQGFVTGITIEENIGYGEPLEEYKSAFMSLHGESLTTENIRQKYLDNLDLLLNDKKAYQVFIDDYVNRGYDKLKTQREYAENNLNSTVMHAYTNKFDLIEMIEKNECAKVNILDMKLSPLAK